MPVAFVSCWYPANCCSSRYQRSVGIFTKTLFISFRKISARLLAMLSSNSAMISKPFWLIKELTVRPAETVRRISGKLGRRINYLPKISFPLNKLSNCALKPPTRNFTFMPSTCMISLLFLWVNVMFVVILVRISKSFNWQLPWPTRGNTRICPFKLYFDLISSSGMSMSKFQCPWLPCLINLFHQKMRVSYTRNKQSGRFFITLSFSA